MIPLNVNGQPDVLAGPDDRIGRFDPGNDGRAGRQGHQIQGLRRVGRSAADGPPADDRLAHHPKSKWFVRFLRGLQGRENQGGDHLPRPDESLGGVKSRRQILHPDPNRTLETLRASRRNGQGHAAAPGHVGVSSSGGPPVYIEQISIVQKEPKVGFGPPDGEAVGIPGTTGAAQAAQMGQVGSVHTSPEQEIGVFPRQRPAVVVPVGEGHGRKEFLAHGSAGIPHQDLVDASVDGMILRVRPQPADPFSQDALGHRKVVRPADGAFQADQLPPVQENEIQGVVAGVVLQSEAVQKEIARAQRAVVEVLGQHFQDGSGNRPSLHVQHLQNRVKGRGEAAGPDFQNQGFVPASREREQILVAGSAGAAVHGHRNRERLGVRHRVVGFRLQDLGSVPQNHGQGVEARPQRGSEPDLESVLPCVRREIVPSDRCPASQVVAGDGQLFSAPPAQPQGEDARQEGEPA